MPVLSSLVAEVWTDLNPLVGRGGGDGELREWLLQTG